MYDKVYEKLSYKFNDVGLLEQAFTHSSYAHEHGDNSAKHNERLEYLGDAVLELLISDLLYNQFPEFDEGQLTKFRAGLVCEPSLAKLAHEAGFEEYLRLGKGEENIGGRYREALLADVFEAVVGAMFLDGGLQCAQTFVHACFADAIENPVSFDQFDNKTFLQESFQKNSKIPLNYVISNESGPEHKKKFTAKVEHNGKLLGTGDGRSKKEAEQNAAAEAISKLGLN